MKVIYWFWLIASISACKNSTKQFDDRVMDSISQNVRSKFINTYNSYDRTFFSRQDSCVIVSFLLKRFNPTYLDVPKLYLNRVKITPYTESYLGYSFSVIEDELHNLEYYGLGDVYTLKSLKFQSDSSARMWDNTQLSLLLDRYSNTSMDNRITLARALISSLYDVRPSRVINYPREALEQIPTSAKNIEVLRDFCSNSSSEYFLYDDDCCGFIVFSIDFTGGVVDVRELLLPNGAFRFEPDLPPLDVECLKF